MEELEDRLAPAVTTTGIPFWSEQGPGENTGGQVQNVIPDNQVAGAVSALAADPSNADILYAATVSGGIWKTTNATALNPTWLPKTDHYPSLSIGDISMSPIDSNVLYAGTSRVSSSGDGENTTGLLRTTDGGDTWTMLGQSTFSGQNIIKVRPTDLGSGAIVVVATSVGVYRSTDGGVNWTLISGTGGLPVGGTTDMVGDPSNIHRLYVAIPSTAQRVFRSEDGGLNWVAAGLPATAGRIRLTVGAGSVVYAATMNFQLSDVFRSATLGASWESIGAPSPTIHPGGQASVHFSFLGDRNDPNVVFIGGDRQAYPFTNGCTNYTGNHFRGVYASGWTSLDCNGATLGGSPTSPHADSRSLAFDANGNLLESDDGGIYRLINPSGAPNTRRWVSVIGSSGGITPTEFYSIAYDSVNHTLLGGAQDTGSPEQTAPGSFSWRDTTQADGAVVASDNTSFAAHSIHYSSIQELAGFHRRTFNNAGMLQSDVDVQLNISGTSPTRNLFQVEDNIPGGSTIHFIQPYVLNNVDPRLMVIGTSFLYESTIPDYGDTLTSVGGLINLGGGNWRPDRPVGSVQSIDYGGFSGGVSNTQVLWIGTSNLLRQRSSGTGLPALVVAYPGSTVRSVRMDPTDWHTAYVLDSLGRVWRTTDTGASWTNLTGNLPSLTPSPRTIEVVHIGGNVAILIGGQGGVYRALNPGTVTATWSRFGSNLSNAIVRDMHYNATDDDLVIGTLGRGAWKVTSASVPLFQVSLVTVDGTAGNDLITLARDPNIPGVLNIFLNSSVPVFSVVAASVQQIIVNGNGGNDTINVNDSFPDTPVTVNMSTAGCTVNISSIEHNLSHILADVMVNGAATGVDSLSVNDQANAANTTYTLFANTFQRTGAGLVSINNLVSTVTLNAGNGGNLYDIRNTNSFAATALNTGTGNDTVNIRSTTRSLIIQEQGGGNDTANVGSVDQNLNTIQGLVTVNGNSGIDMLNINDQSGAAGPLTYAIASSSIGRAGTAGIIYTLMSSIVVNGSNGADTYNVSGTEGGSFGPVTTINGGNGGNTINVLATSGALAVISGAGGDVINVGTGGSSSTINNIQGNVTINGQAGPTSLFINDQGNPPAPARSYTITSTAVSRTGPPTVVGTIAYSNIRTLVLNGSSSYVVEGTAAGTATTVNCGPGDDTITVGNSGNTLNGIQGPLTVNGQGGTDSLTLNDQGNGNAQNYTLSASTVNRSGMATISYFNLQALTLNGSSAGGNSFLISSTMGSFPTTLSGDGNLDVLNVQGASATGTLTIQLPGGNATLNISNANNRVDGISSVTVNDLRATSRVFVDDSGFNSDETYRITNASVDATRLGVSLLAYNNIGALVLNGGTSVANDRFTIDSTSAPAGTAINGGTGPNCFSISPFTLYLASILGPLSVAGNGGDILSFWDTANPAPETYNFNNPPSLLTLTTVPVSVNFSGMAAIYLQTNGMSTVNDPSGTVIVDGSPPCLPGSHSVEPEVVPFLPDRVRLAAVLGVVQDPGAMPQVTALEALVHDVANHVAKESSQWKLFIAEAHAADSFQFQAVDCVLDHRE